MKIEKYTEIECRMYGDYNCSCGCGRPLGNPGMVFPDSICHGVSTMDDVEEGYHWRMFTPKCWKRVKKGKTLQQIYNTYPESPLNGEGDQ